MILIIAWKKTDPNEKIISSSYEVTLQVEIGIIALSQISDDESQLTDPVGFVEKTTLPL